MDEDSEFILPKSSKRRKNRKDFNPLSFSQKLDREAAVINSHSEWLENTRGIVKNAVTAMRWSKPPNLLCLGLGSPSESRSARLQLALAKDLMGHLDIPPSNGRFYDPVFTDGDIESLKALGFEVLNGQIEADTPHVMTGPTLLFMPHCDVALNERILQSNYFHEGICNLVLLGNTLEQYLISKSTSDLDEKYPCIKAIASNSHWHRKDLMEAPFDDKAFAALSVQYLYFAETSLSGNDRFP